MKSRNSYHSTIKLAFAMDIQNQWLPKDFLQSIPRSTAHGWKSETRDKFIGHEFASGINDNVEELKQIFDKRVAREKQLFIAYTRIKITLLTVIGNKNLRSIFSDNFRTIVKMVESSKSSFKGGAKSLYSLLNITTHTYNHWKSVAHFHCSKSPLGICVKRVPGQITSIELNTMKSMLSRKQFEHWPICSVWDMPCVKVLLISLYPHGINTIRDLTLE